MLLGLSDAKPSAETAESTNHYLEKLLFTSVGVPLVLQYFAIVTATDQFALTSSFFFFDTQMFLCFCDVEAHPTTKWTKLLFIICKG